MPLWLLLLLLLHGAATGHLIGPAAQMMARTPRCCSAPVNAAASVQDVHVDPSASCISR